MNRVCGAQLCVGASLTLITRVRSSLSGISDATGFCPISGISDATMHYTTSYLGGGAYTAQTCWFMRAHTGACALRLDAPTALRDYCSYIALALHDIVVIENTLLAGAEELSSEV